MRTAALFALSALVLGLAACTTTAPEPAEPVRITLERGVCFGFCPDYEVTITGDGQVSYNGRRFVRVSGEQHGAAAPADVAHLVNMIDAAHFFDLKDAYRGAVTDLPTYRVTFQRGDQTKTVTDYAGEMAGMPHAVREIEAEIDRVANTDQWVKNADGTYTRKP